VGKIRDVAREAPPGLEAKVTGPAGVSYDGSKVFNSINSKLLLVTASLVFVLLVIIYRSPIFWTIPLLSVGFAEVTSEGLGYALTQAGVTINGQTAGVLTVLVFGAGTDYALLLVARYREELHRHEDRHEAMGIALRRAGPVIFASACTVMAALLCMIAAEVNGTRGPARSARLGSRSRW
jgi:RND superfamily putative drug exporter